MVLTAASPHEAVVLTFATTPVSRPAPPVTATCCSTTRYPSSTSSPISTRHDTEASPSSVALKAWNMKPPIPIISLSYVPSAHPAPDKLRVDMSNGGSSSWARPGTKRRGAKRAARILSVIIGGQERPAGVCRRHSASLGPWSSCARYMYPRPSWTSCRKARWSSTCRGTGRSFAMSG